MHIPIIQKESTIPPELQERAALALSADDRASRSAQVCGVGQRFPSFPQIHGLDPKVLSGLSRVYVGSIPFDRNEEQMRMAFSPFGAVKSVSMTYDPATGRHKGFCFVEFETPEATVLSIEFMHGLEMSGRSLRVGRPSNFANYDISTLPQPPKSRLYVSNVSEFVSEDEIRTLFETFGPVEKCALIPDRISRKHKSCGYVQFVDEAPVPVALATLARFELGGRTLYVRPALIGTEFPAGMRSLGHASPPQIPDWVKGVANSINSSAAGAGGEEEAPLDEHVSISATQRYSMMQKMMRPTEDGVVALTRIQASTVLELRNMVTVGDVDEFLQSEIASECEKYGAVARVVLWRDPATPPKPEDLMLVFVEFGSIDAAIKARLALEGRFFGGRRIQAVYSRLPAA
nr:Poly(U)-binding-splicing factor puf60 [Polyrhizophydium stewartii]